MASSDSATTTKKTAAPSKVLKLTAYINKVRSDPFYKEGTPDYRRRVDELMYETKVNPYMMRHGFVPPTKEAFLGEAVNQKAKEPGKSFSENMAYAGAATMKSALNVAQAANKASESIMFGMTAGLAGLDPNSTKGYNAVDKYLEDKKKVYDRFLGAEYYHNWVGSVAGTVGEQIPMLPIYALAGALTEGAGAVAGAAKLTKAQQFITKRLIDAADGYTYGAVTGDSKLESAVTFATVNPIMGAMGKYAAKPALKLAGEYLGKIWRWGGPKLVRESLANAAKTIEEEAAKPVREIIEKEKYADLAPEQKAKAEALDKLPKPPVNPLKEKIQKANIILLNNLSKEHHNGKLFQFLKQDEKANILEMAAKAAGDHASVPDDEIFPAQVQDAIEKQVKSNPQFAAAKEKIEQVTGLKVAETVTKHVKDTVKVVSDNQLEKANAISRALKNSDKVIEPTTENIPHFITSAKPKYGYGNKLFDVEFENPVDKALYTVAQDNKNKTHEQTMEFLRTRFPNLTDEQIQIKGKAVKATIKSQAQYGEVGKPLKITSLSDPQIAPGAAKGKSPEFFENLKQLVKGYWHFEDDLHEVLWMYDNRQKVPSLKPYSKIIAQHYKDQTKGISPAALKEMRANLNDHLDKLTLAGNHPEVAKHGEGKVFRSTNLSGNPTIYQDGLDHLIAEMETAAAHGNNEWVRGALESIKRVSDKLGMKPAKGGK